jgi:hypothetical protein
MQQGNLAWAVAGSCHCMFKKTLCICRGCMVFRQVGHFFCMSEQRTYHKCHVLPLQKRAHHVPEATTACSCTVITHLRAHCSCKAVVAIHMATCAASHLPPVTAAHGLQGNGRARVDAGHRTTLAGQVRVQGQVHGIAGLVPRLQDIAGRSQQPANRAATTGMGAVKSLIGQCMQ